jgi:hypothetical protein
MASREFFRILVNRGAAIVQIAVTKPVVIKTTSTQPGTSPLSEAKALPILLHLYRSIAPRLQLIDLSIVLSVVFCIAFPFASSYSLPMK